MEALVSDTTPPTAREARKFAQKHLSAAQSALYGKGGMSKAEKVERLTSAKDAVLRAYSALEHAIAETEKETEVEFAPAAVDAVPFSSEDEDN